MQSIAASLGLSQAQRAGGHQQPSHAAGLAASFIQSPALRQEYAAALPPCCEPGQLDFTRLPQHLQPLVPDMPAAAWHQLQAMAGQVTSLRLPAVLRAAELAQYATAWPALPGLRRIELQSPLEGHVIDLRHLPPSRLELCLEGRRVAAWEVHVPEGTLVHARGPATEALHPEKPRVLHWTADGSRSTTGTVCGLIYHRQPTARPDDEHPASRPAQARRALNGRARFQDGTPIVCRHLALQWLNDRARHERAGAGEPGRFPFHGFSSTERIAGHVMPDTQAQFARMLSRRATAVFHIDRFGELLRAQLGPMQQGDARRFAILSTDHLMALELQRKAAAAVTGRSTEWVVTVYDPNATGTHARLVLHELAGLEDRRLAHFFMPRATVASLASFPVAIAWRMDEDRAASRAPEPSTIIGLDDSLQQEPAYLCQLIAAGYTAQVRRALSGAIRLAERDPRAAYRRLTQAGVALSEDRLEEAAAVLHAVLGPSGLSEADRVDLLRGRGLDRTTALGWALVQGRAGSVALYARSILAVADERLGPAARLALLERSALAGAARLDVGRASPQPIDDAIYALVHEIAVSARVSMVDKVRLLTRPAPAAPSLLRAALDAHRAGAAAAIACAVLEARLPADGEPLVDGEDIPGLLEGLSMDRRAGRRWLQRLLHALARSDPAAGAAPADRGPLQGYQPPADSPEVRRLLQARSLAVCGSLRGDPARVHPGLTALALDSHPGQMVCRADAPIEELAPWRLLPRTRLGSSLDFNDIRYLLPIELLQPAPTPGPAPRPVRYRIEQTPQSLLDAPGVSLRRATEGFHARAAAAGLRALHVLRSNPGAMVCVSETPLGELSGYAMALSPSKGLTGPASHFYLLPLRLLCVHPRLDD